MADRYDHAAIEEKWQRRWEEAGAARVVLSSGALGDEPAVEDLLASARPGELVVGIEVADGRVRSRGIGSVDLDLMSTLGWLRRAGATSFLVTAAERVGTVAGPDVDVIRRVARRGVETLAAGGPTRHQSSMSSTAADSPCRCRPTEPSPSLRTQPRRPRSAPSRRAEAR